MRNLFSVFDPSSVFNINWLSFMLIAIRTPSIYWLSRESFKTSYTKVILTLKTEFNSLNYPINAPGISQYTLSLFTFIWLNNILRLFPYIFSSTAHPILAITLILPLWLGQYFYRWLISTKLILAHLVPQGTPAALTPIIVLIELTRNIIRPLTLTVRLVANISAGHLLLTLIGRIIAINSISFILILMVVLVGRITLSILELGVRFIQAYVFSMLITLFIKEVNDSSLY